mmetsp:Transcript_13664/g.31873  ORF Transcript_13664/g.31873 Transcript_13664/m.31873 type:complete len:564 (+) Transcript_13664:162-1853(+)
MYWYGRQAAGKLVSNSKILVTPKAHVRNEQIKVLVFCSGICSDEGNGYAKHFNKERVHFILGGRPAKKMKRKVPPQHVGRVKLRSSGWHRIFFRQCSCVIFSTIFSPIASFQFAPTPIPSHARFSYRAPGQSLGRPKATWENSKHNVVQRQSFVLPPYTLLRMSTSLPSGGWNVSDSLTWNDSCDEEIRGDQGSETESIILQEHRTWSKAVKAALKTLGKKRNSLQSELTKAESVESTAARAQLLVSNLYLFQDGVKTAIVNDWENDGKEVELTLDSTGKYDSASAEADALFSIVRKLKRGSKIIVDLLQETDEAWEILSEAEMDLKSAFGEDEEVDEGRLAIVKDRLIRTSRTTNFQVPTPDDNNAKAKSKRGGQSNKSRREKKPELGTPASNVRKLISPGGCTVLVGRNRRGNEYLSMTVARGNDIWMHSRGCPGAHVIIQNRRGGPTVTDECLQFGADLAIFYSDLRNEEKADVTAAEPKHIQKPRGAPLGAVKLREEWKTFVGRPGQVPGQLKEAREESGQTDEYHMFDKAKHRRRTKQVVEEDRARKRQQQREKKNQR